MFFANVVGLPPATSQWPWVRVFPHKCPVCEGRGNVPHGFYGPSPGTNSEKCKSCDGAGVLWRHI